MRKIGELKGKPIIEGNPNEIKKNQIHYKESDGNITLSERKEDNTLSSVTSVSGSGEGVKEYYYKTDESNKEMILMILLELLSSCNINVLLKRVSNEVVFETSLTVCFSAFEDATSQYVGYIKLDGRPFTAIRLDDYNNIEPIGIFEGNITDIFNKIGMSEYSNYFQEITKEEYESMITYKPE
jgi:hypothetical protein